MPEQRLSIRVEDHVATVAMQRGERHNALDGQMFTELAGIEERLAQETGVRVVVLHGEGPSFCSGLDIASLAAGNGGVGLGDILNERGPRHDNLAQRASLAWSHLPVPVIAAIHGACFGGGLQVALGADIRIAAPDARLSVLEVKWGLVPDMGITQTLPRLVRADVGRELTYTGRVVSGAEAAEIGLVTRAADDPLAAAQELAGQIAGRSPDAVRAAKRLYTEAWDAPAKEALELETELQLTLLGSPNQTAAVMAGSTGEAPDFTDP